LLSIWSSLGTNTEGEGGHVSVLFPGHVHLRTPLRRIIFLAVPRRERESEREREEKENTRLGVIFFL
jgi:hypothetical protein